jgi:hypothetical protein
MKWLCLKTHSLSFGFKSLGISFSPQLLHLLLQMCQPLGLLSGVALLCGLGHQRRSVRRLIRDEALRKGLERIHQGLRVHIQFAAAARTV